MSTAPKLPIAPVGIGHDVRVRTGGRVLGVAKADILVMLALVLVVGAYTVWWVNLDVNSFTIQTHGDQALIQASAQVAMQTGPWATNGHVGWFSGFNPWSFPATSSLAFYGGAWFLGLFVSSSSNVLALLMGATAAAVAAATYVAIRAAAPGSTSRLVAALGGFTMGLSPYVLSKMGHFNVASWYLIPVVIAAIAVLARSSLQGAKRARMLVMLSAVALGALISPLWWSLVAVYVVVLGGLLAALLRQWTWLRATTMTAAALLAGTAIPAFLAIVNRVPGGSWNRQPWDSVLFGGSIFDVVFASPWIARIWPESIDVTPALSRELSSVGLVAGLALAFALIASLTAFVGFGDRWREHRWLFVATQVSLLAFLSMGLGPFQEAVLAIIGVESPLRVWSRLIVIVALFGMILAAPVLSRWARKGVKGGLPGRIAVSVAALLVAGAAVADTAGIDLMTPRTIPDQPETEAVAYLASDFGDCPVAQLPVGTFPDFPMFDGSEESIEYFYRGFVPYLLNPEGRWSFGAPAGTQTDQLMRSLPSDVGSDSLALLASSGYCAVLFDTQYSQWLQRRGGDWAAMRIPDAVPQWQNDRFAIYRL